jgi:ABC-type multidrug transport system ATPase subunit
MEAVIMATTGRSAQREAGLVEPSPTPVLRAVGIAKTYHRRRPLGRRAASVLQGADLEVRPGEVVGVAGENGSGKSTLMKILAGELRADSGTVEIDGRLGYCPQEPLVYPRLTCDEHLELFGRAYGMADVAMRSRRSEIYDELGFARFAQQRAERLSGGTLAKLNLALALLPDPEVLLLYEPYAGFDWDTYLKFWSLVAASRERGKAVVIVSHFIVDEERFTRIVDVRDGRVWPR